MREFRIIMPPSTIEPPLGPPILVTGEDGSCYWEYHEPRVDRLSNDHTASIIGLLYGHDPEPYVGELFRVPETVASSGVVIARSYVFRDATDEVSAEAARTQYMLGGSEQFPMGAAWNVYVDPVIEDPCDEEFLEELDNGST